MEMVEEKQAVGMDEVGAKKTGKFDLTELLASKNADEFTRKRAELINSLVQNSKDPDGLVKLQEQIDAKIHAAVNSDSKTFGEEFDGLLKEAKEKFGKAAVVAQEVAQKTGDSLREVVANRQEICDAVVHEAGKVMEDVGEGLRELATDTKDVLREVEDGAGQVLGKVKGMAKEKKYA